MLRRLPHQLRLLARVLAPERRSSRARRGASARTRRRGGTRPALEVDRALELRRDRRSAGERRHVVDPLAGGERRVRVDVVRLPERARVGRDRAAADLHLVADDPGHHARAPRTTSTTPTTRRAPRWCHAMNAASTSGSAASRVLPRIATPSDAPVAAASHSDRGCARRAARAGRAPRRRAGRRSRG